MQYCNNTPEYVKNCLECAENMPGGFFVYKADESEKILFANREFIKIFECNDFDDFMNLTGGTFSGVVYPDDLKRVQAQIKAQIENAASDERFDYVQYRIKTKKGRVRYIEDFGKHVKNYNGEDLFFVFAVDLKDKLLSHDLDPLTGLLNRRSFQDNARLILKNLSVEEKLGMAFVWFNIDNFKLYNKRFGFEGGNDLLREAAYELSAFFPDGIISRFADDHFVVFTTWDGLDGENEIEEIQAKLSAINKNAALRFRAGIYFPSYAEDEKVETACDRAKLACDIIKRNHSVNFCVYQENMTKNLLKSQEIVNKLDYAIANGDIKVYYQPIVRVLTGKICETEALTRWEDTRGSISPSDFIPALEQYHDIHKLDIFMINQVCSDYKARRSKGLPLLPVSINLSRMDFELCDIYSEVEKAVSSNEMPKNMLKIEITESVHGEDLNILTLGIEKFKQNGYEVWMDDFGSGYSSLNTLKDYNFDTIKFDMKILSDLEKSPKSRFILNSNLSMAKQLGIQSLAEGVETNEQLAYLKNIGFEKAQGYLFGKPMTLDDVFALEIPKEDFRDTPYYEKLGGIDIPNQENMLRSMPCNYSVADVKAMALIEIRGDELISLTENDVFREKILSMQDKFDNLRETKNHELLNLKNIMLDISRKIRTIKDNCEITTQKFYALLNCERYNISMTRITSNPETGAEAYLIICESA